MSSLVLDPAVLLLPDGSVATDSLNERVHRLSQIRMIQQDVRCLRVCFAQETRDLLQLEDSCITWERLKRLVVAAPAEFEQWSISDLHVVYEHLLESLLPLAEGTGCADVVACDVSMEPTLPPMDCRPEFQEVREKTLLLCGLGIALGTSRSPLCVLLGERFGGDSMTVKGKAEIVELADGSLLDPSGVPISVEQGVMVRDRLSNVLLGVDPSDSIGTIDSSDEYFGALAHAVWLRQRQSSLPSAHRFCLGTGFVRSLRDNAALKDGPFSRTAFQKTVDTICGLNRVVPFSTAAGGSQTRKRAADGASALRAHITEGHQALRLMIWEREDGIWELANVGSKSELLINDGVPAEAIGHPDALLLMA